MSYICDICGKGKQFGHNVSFSQRKTKRVFKPNLHVKKLEIDGRRQKTKICAQCLRTLKKEQPTKDPVASATSQDTITEK